MNYWTSAVDQSFEDSFQSHQDFIDKTEIEEDKFKNITINDGINEPAFPFINDFGDFLNMGENSHKENDGDLLNVESYQRNSSRLIKKKSF